MKKRIVRLLSRFLLAILLFSFIVIVNFVLFFSYERAEHISNEYARLIIAGNIIFLSIVFTILDMVYRRQTVEIPIRRIQAALDRVIAGDFSTRIAYLKGPHSGNEFDEVITLINHMIEELSGVETLRTDFIANVSHELKTPLAAMQNYGVLLQDPNLPAEKRKEYGKAIAEQTRNLSSLITNILKLNKLENQQIFPNIEEYNLTEQLCDCMLEFETIWEEKSIEIQTDLAEDVMLKADKELLSLVWHNLLSNALKFTGPGGTVSLRLYEEEDGIYVEVEDTGCGISPEAGKHIFKRFYQGDTSHATKGNGLGLALVKRVIDICKGEITVSSTLGKGSTFTVKLYK